MNRLEDEARISKTETLATQISRLDLVLLDELGYLPFARSGGQLLFHLVSKLYEPPRRHHHRSGVRQVAERLR